MVMGKPFRSMLSARFSPITASPTSPICDLAMLSLDPRAAAFHHVLHFLERHHRRVAAGRLGERPVGRAVLHRLLGALAREQAVDHAAREAVAAADAVL